MAIAWLRSLQNAHGGWPSVARESQPPGGTGDPDASAQIAFLMREIYGEGDPLYRKGRELLERHFDEAAGDVERGYRIRVVDGQPEKMEVYGLTHLLLSWLGDRPRRIEDGYDASDPRVGRMMEALIDAQGEDGGWQPFWADESSPVYTALAVKVLVWTGVLAPEDLVCELREYSN
jgi:hypothetical protein